jgi:prophage regulatory protein
MNTEAKERRVIRKPELMHRLGLSDTTVWRMERQGRFPKRVRLGGKAVGWFSDEITDWIAKRAEERE